MTSTSDTSRTPPAEVTERVAIVTGGSQGIGAGVVDAFRAQGYGVVAAALTMEQPADPGIVSVSGDVADPETARRIVDAALTRFGRVDTLVNNAGIYIGKPFTDYTASDYAAITAVNLTGFLNLTQLVLPAMIEQKGGHVVNVSTSLVDQPDHTRPAGLAALTKGGLQAVTRSLAIEYAAEGIRFNAVSLGVIKTAMHDPASYDGMAKLHPLNRVGEVADVVDGILYLERATFVTGEILHIDGGQSAGH
jgi:NAD(P)-dependent dehydrogenase (short-subunit alcohol dehydrogenase family)